MAGEILDALGRDPKRFLREIRTTAQLEDPGVGPGRCVEVIGIGPSLDGQQGSGWWASCGG
ncbi:MAG: hypothetical protein ABIZ05_11370 [Pseudonocardiaceae bacterium]